MSLLKRDVRQLCAATGEDAAGGPKMRQGEHHVAGVRDSQEAEHLAQPWFALHTTMAKPEGDEGTPSADARAH